MKSFIEERLDVGYDYGETGGPGFDTDIVELSSGHEHRNANWSDARGEWELGERNINKADKDYLLSFFRAVHGRAIGFRFKDWQDFEADGESLDPDGTPTVQLRKTYTLAGEDQVREIHKPVDDSVTMKRDGSDYTPSSVDTETGVVTLEKDSDLDIADVTAASPAAVQTEDDHGLSTGDVIYITGTGLDEIDDQAWTITVTDDDTFTLDDSDTSDTDGADNGSVEKYVQPDEDLTWSGEFDVPARFDIDRFQARFVGTDDREYVYALSTLPVVEIRP